MTCVLVTSRSWNELLVKQLEEKTGKSFYLINKKDLMTVHLEKVKPQYVFFSRWSHIIPKEFLSLFVRKLF